MMSLIWFGVFERYPTLQVVHVEADAGWLPYWLQRMEQHWEFSGNAEHPDLKRRPTEYFKSNFFVACRGDETTLPSVVDARRRRQLHLQHRLPASRRHVAVGHRTPRKTTDPAIEHPEDLLGQRGFRVRREFESELRVTTA